MKITNSLMTFAQVKKTLHANCLATLLAVSICFSNRHCMALSLAYSACNQHSAMNMKFIISYTTGCCMHVLIGTKSIKTVWLSTVILYNCTSRVNNMNTWSISDFNPIKINHCKLKLLNVQLARRYALSVCMGMKMKENREAKNCYFTQVEYIEVKDVIVF